MRGFFTKKDVTKIRKSQEELHRQKDPCEICGLYKTCQSPKMKYTGQGKKKILIVGEAAGRTEDEDWEDLGYDEPTQFIGQAGNLLRRKLKPFNIDLDRDCWKINSLLCRPPKNRKPTKREIKLCRPNIDRAIEEFKPEFIWLLGGSAVESFYMGRFSNLSITRWRKLCIPDRRTNAWILPMYHPSYLLRNETDKNLEITYDGDLKWVVSCLGKDHPEFEDFEEQINTLFSIEEVIPFLEGILQRKPLIAFDYEATGLKPFEDGHKIWCIAINGKSFPYDYYDNYTGNEYWDSYQKDQIKNLWQKILLDSEIKKVAHNLKFEDMWSRSIFDVEKVNGWEQCTMTTAHVLDSRSNFTGLKFQAYINYGIEGYEKEVKQFIAPKGKDKLNRLNEAPLEKLLKYNALDSILTLRLYEDQKKILSRKRKLRKANDFFRDGLIAFANTQQVGIQADKNYYLEQEKLLDDRIKKIETKLLSGKEARLFKKKTGNELKIAKDLSVKDLRILLFDVLGIKIEKKTEKAKLASVDHDVLTQINIPFTKRLLQRRKLFKVRNTYLAQFMREIVNNKIHPFFDLHTARTFRSSSSLPNFQNIPVRDEEAKKICRSGIMPSPGNKLACIDYGSIEVRIAACYTKDPVLIEYINDPTTDMHRDQAEEIFLLNAEQVTKEIRFYTKNQLVFPEFYGSWYGACAASLWECCIDLKMRDGIKVKKHLKNEGIKDYDDFENHVKQVETDFWEKFNVYAEWKEKVIKDYHKKGYVEMFFGHRRIGYLTNNMILNSAIQGTAFHCLLWSFIELDKEFEKRKYKTKLVAQIHDELIPDLCPPEEKEVLKLVKYIMTEKIREGHDWLIVPLEIDAEITEVDQSWYDKKKLSYEI